MGILLEDAKLLLRLSQENVSFKRTLTLGRQQLFFHPTELEPELRLSKASNQLISEFLSSSKNGGPADLFFKALGAQTLKVMDASLYEGADIQHDLNLPIEENLFESFDAVFDGGTLEHVFNFPVAISNVMKMVKKGGAFVSITPANNQLGHGFYQFSPELFYTVFSKKNGFQIENMVALEISPAHRQYSVADPSSIRSRVTLCNSWPVNLLVHAKKIENLPLFQETPQQSDYVAAWSNEAAFPTASKKTSFKLKFLKKILVRKLPALVLILATFFKILIGKDFGFRNTRFYKRIP